MTTNKYVAKLIEQKNKQNIRKYYSTISDINLTLAKIHQTISKQIDISLYESVTNYVNQYISHTTVWNLKFTMNLESAEVALLQIFHLEFIFSSEPSHSFEEEKAVLREQSKLFYDLKPFPEEHIEKRKNIMYKYIELENANK